MRRSLVVVSITAILVAAGGLIATRGGHAEPAATAPQQPPAVAEDETLDATRPASPMLLPQPTGYVDGVPVGYPRSEPGAVAAAFGYSRLGTGLNVDATLRAISSIADPTSDWFERTRDSLGDSLVAQRRSMGLAPTGSNGAASATVSPAAYQLRKVTPTQATVLTLNVFSGVDSRGSTMSGPIVMRWQLRWDGDRWRATETYLDDRDTRLAAVPSTSDARAKGWQVAHGG